jgi:hypothetical protein
MYESWLFQLKLTIIKSNKSVRDAKRRATWLASLIGYRISPQNPWTFTTRLGISTFVLENLNIILKPSL